MTLEQQLLDLMDKHSLTAVSVGMHRLADGRTFPSAYAHAKDAECGSSTGAESIELCLGQAVAEVIGNRIVAMAGPVAPLPAATEEQ